MPPAAIKMSWLNSFDPAAPTRSLGEPDSLSQSRQEPRSNARWPARTQGTFQNSTAGPSTARTRNEAPSQVSACPPPTAGNAHIFRPPSSAAFKSSIYAHRPPRLPNSIKAAPPSAALRPEDAQPNEHQIRTKPWEIDAPPSIGKSKSSHHALPLRVTTPLQASQPTSEFAARSSLPLSTQAQRSLPRHLPSRPSDKQTQGMPRSQLQDRRPSQKRRWSLQQTQTKPQPELELQSQVQPGNQSQPSFAHIPGHPPGLRMRRRESSRNRRTKRRHDKSSIAEGSGSKKISRMTVNLTRTRATLDSHRLEIERLTELNHPHTKWRELGL